MPEGVGYGKKRKKGENPFSGAMKVLKPDPEMRAAGGDVGKMIRERRRKKKAERPKER